MRDVRPTPPPIVALPPKGSARGSRPKLAVAIEKNTVRVAIVCSDRDAATLLYDQIVAAAKMGMVEINIGTVVR